MAYIKQKKNGRWFAQIDIKGHPRMTKTHDSEKLANAWASKEETRINAKAAGLYVAPEGSVGELIGKYVTEVGKTKKWSDTKQDNLDKIIDQVGGIALADFGPQQLIDYAHRLRQTRGAAGTAERIGYLIVAFETAASIPAWKMSIDVAPLKAAASGLRKIGVTGNSKARKKVLDATDINEVRQSLDPLMQDLTDFLRLIPFRACEACEMEWKDVNFNDRSVTLYRKSPDGPRALVQRVALPVLKMKDGTEIDTFAIIAKRRETSPERPFPISRTAASTRFQRAHQALGIDMHMHDLRSHAMGNLFSLGYQLPEVCHLSGHLNWTTVGKNYGHLGTENVHSRFAQQAKINGQGDDMAVLREQLATQAATMQAMQAMMLKMLGHNGGPMMEAA